MRSLTIAGPAGALHVVDHPAAGAHSPAGAPPAAGADPAPAALPVVLVHGMVAHAGFWEAPLAHASGRRRAVAVDLRGHGASEPPADADYAPSACAADVLAVLDALALPRVALVGHSYGALAALAAAAAHPERVARLVLADPPRDFSQVPAAGKAQHFAPYIAALEADGWRDTAVATFNEALAGSAPATRETVLSRAAVVPHDQMLGMSRHLLEFEAASALDRYLAAPGARAHAILAPSNAWPLSLHVLRPALTSVVLPGTSHWLMLDAPSAFAAALEAWLDAP
ncbi:hydrolase [Sorangium cellulosum]|uniref:Hydrolase n=1 Tax=Sorangium cellulosum TaxID=56 RepID=A0A150TH71_SORCE|nr:hydrolase [Sorangium cellulosum]